MPWLFIKYDAKKGDLQLNNNTRLAIKTSPDLFWKAVIKICCQIYMKNGVKKGAINFLKITR